MFDLGKLKRRRRRQMDVYYNIVYYLYRLHYSRSMKKYKLSSRRK
jgi:hypothetical protein